LEFTVNTARTCFEIVHFAFQPDIDMTRQIDAMKTLGDWAAMQPGFVARQSYLDPSQARWTDVVAWSSLDEAKSAMERSQREPSLAGIMALIAPETVHAGHYEKML
jgi:hypothetical protein